MVPIAQMLAFGEQWLTDMALTTVGWHSLLIVVSHLMMFQEFVILWLMPDGLLFKEINNVQVLPISLLAMLGVT
jgi:hypothetical protein